MPDFAHAIDLQVLLKDSFNPGLQFFVTLGAIRQARRIGQLGLVVGKRDVAPLCGEA